MPSYNSTHTGAQHDSYVTNTELINLIYPVGAVYISTVATNPGTLFGVGTWTQIQDRFLLCAGSTYAAGGTGGAASHTHTTNAGTTGGPSTNTSGSTALTVAQLPSHNHEMPVWMWAVSTGFNTGTYNIPGSGNRTGNAIPYNDNRTSQPQYTSSTGSGSGHTHTLSSHTHSQVSVGTSSGSNLPPYIAVYVWKRTA